MKESVAPSTFVCEDEPVHGGRAESTGLCRPLVGHRSSGDPVDPWRSRVPVPQDPSTPQMCLSVEWAISDITEKTSRGKAMLIVTSEARFENQDGALLAENRETLIYLEV